MRYPRVLVVAALVILTGLAYFGNRTPLAAQGSHEILPGCSIPKAYGRLVALMNPPNSSLAGQAVFEAEDGTVRWVALMFSGDLPQLPKAQKKAAPMFPQLPRYECSLGDVWTRH
jgi:hypothetical protein